MYPASPGTFIVWFVASVVCCTMRTPSTADNFSTAKYVSPTDPPNVPPPVGALTPLFA